MAKEPLFDWFAKMCCDEGVGVSDEPFPEENAFLRSRVNDSRGIAHEVGRGVTMRRRNSKPHRASTIMGAQIFGPSPTHVYERLIVSFMIYGNSFRMYFAFCAFYILVPELLLVEDLLSAELAFFSIFSSCISQSYRVWQFVGSVKAVFVAV